MKRLPYADHIIALDSNGTIAEQGDFEKLNHTGGYVASFSLPPAEWDYKQDEQEIADRAAAKPYVYKAYDPDSALEEAAADASRQTGDVSIYLYYVRSVGWFPTIVFVVSMTVFVFCTSFPSSSHNPSDTAPSTCANA